MYDELMQKAREVRQNAHCLYSHFAVGAALLAKDGTVYTGCNVENGAYPMCLCAERNAFGSAVADGKKRGDFQAIAIVGGQEGGEPGTPCYPCGACRQVMAEFCGEDFEIVLTDRVYKLKELLPFAFFL
jgi:cytidine deaminase